MYHVSNNIFHILLGNENNWFEPSVLTLPVIFVGVMTAASENGRFEVHYADDRLLEVLLFILYTWSRIWHWSFFASYFDAVQDVEQSNS